MLLFLALSCLAAAALGSVAVYQRGAHNRLGAPDGTARLPPKGTPGEQPVARGPDIGLDALQHGDVVLDGNDDYVVIGTLAYREEHDAWTFHVLDAGATRRYLEVRAKDGVVRAALLDLVDDAPIHGRLGDGLTYRSRPLAVEARGDARTSITGENAGRTAGLLRYARYTGPGGALLVVEEEGAAKRAYFGHTLTTEAVTVYPHA